MNKKIFIISICSLILIILFVIAFNYYSRPRLYELDVNQVKEKIDNKESFILCISATYCSHCKEYKPKLEDISKEYRMDIYYIDFDKYSNKEQELFRNYVSFDGGTPVTLFIKNGEEETTVNRINGNVSKDKIISKFKSNGFIK
ncbi:MAG: thioredoxin family protein [Bacilli bacterium]|nr:thioredoxin family protein [Bacilli bacterium]